MVLGRGVNFFLSLLSFFTNVECLENFSYLSSPRRGCGTFNFRKNRSPPGMFFYSVRIDLRWFLDAEWVIFLINTLSAQSIFHISSFRVARAREVCRGFAAVSMRLRFVESRKT